MKTFSQPYCAPVGLHPFVTCKERRDAEKRQTAFQKENLLMKSINIKSKEFDREEILAKNSLVKGFDTIDVNSGVDEKHVTNHGKLIIFINIKIYLLLY